MGLRKISRQENYKTGRINQDLDVKVPKGNWLDDVECRIAAVSRNSKGNPVSGLIKLYRNGVILRTARKVWIDFTIINNDKTKYHVHSMKVYDSLAYDVVIVDDKGVCHYNGYQRRMRQEKYAKEHGTDRPIDSIWLEYAIERQRKKEATDDTDIG